MYFAVHEFSFITYWLSRHSDNSKVLCVVKWRFCVAESQRDCRAQPCQNGGTCIESGDTFSCECPTSFKGRQCELCKSNQQVTLYQTLSISNSRNTPDTFRSMPDIFQVRGGCFTSYHTSARCYLFWRSHSSFNCSALCEKVFLK